MKTSSSLQIPLVLAAALQKDATAGEIFARMRPSCQKEYIKWVAEAKKPETQAKRVASVLQRIRTK